MNMIFLLYPNKDSLQKNRHQWLELRTNLADSHESMVKPSIDKVFYWYWYWRIKCTCADGGKTAKTAEMHLMGLPITS